MSKKIYTCILILSLIFLSGCESKEDIDFPSKNITIIVPYGAGGGVDVTTRVFTEICNNKESLNGKKMIVENVSGGGGAVGHTSVYKSKPDGYTVVAYTNALVNNPIFKDVIYKAEDFKTLGMVCFDPEILVVPKDSKFNKLEDLILYSKKKNVKVSTPGHSTSHHIAASILAEKEGLKFNYLYNDSGSMQMQQLMGNHCDVAFMSVGETISQIKSGTIKALGVMSENRISIINDIPTFKEKNMDYILGAYRGFGCHKDTPEDIYEELKNFFEEIGRSEDCKSSLEKVGIPYMYKNADEFQEYIDSEKIEVREIGDIIKVR